MSRHRWPLPRPPVAPDDNDLFLVNVLISAMVHSIKHMLGPDGTGEEAHTILVRLIATGHKDLFKYPVAMSEDGIEDLLTFVRKEIGVDETD